MRSTSWFLRPDWALMQNCSARYQFGEAALFTAKTVQGPSSRCLYLLHPLPFSVHGVKAKALIKENTRDDALGCSSAGCYSTLPGMGLNLPFLGLQATYPRQTKGFLKFQLVAGQKNPVRSTSEVKCYWSEATLLNLH